MSQQHDAPGGPGTTPLSALTLVPLRAYAYAAHAALYGGRHNNPAKCLRKCSEPEPCGHVHPCVAVN